MAHATGTISDHDIDVEEQEHDEHQPPDEAMQGYPQVLASVTGAPPPQPEPPEMAGPVEDPAPPAPVIAAPAEPPWKESLLIRFGHRLCGFRD